jgi:sugar lactone lactonase YvrE
VALIAHQGVEVHRPRIAAAGCAAALILSAATSWCPTANAQPVAGPAVGTVLIGDTFNNRVVAVAPDGTQTTFLGTGLQDPEGVAADPAGDVLIADFGHFRIVKVAPDGTQSTVGTGLHFPTDVVVDAAGDVVIADSGNNRVVKVAPDGTQSTVGTGLNQPIGVTTDAAGDVLIADTGNNRVIAVAPDGTQTDVGSGLNSPQFLAVDAAGDVLIADTGNNRIVAVAPDGAQSTVLGTGLSTPQALALDAAGDLLIADAENNRVLKLATGGEQSTVGTGLFVPIGVAVVPQRSQTISYTSTAPTHARIGDTYTVTAIGGGSGNPVTFTRNAASAGQCTVTNDGDNSGTVAFTGYGYCAIFGHQEGNDDYAPATVPARQRIFVYKQAQTIEFTSTPPSLARAGSDYTVTASGGGSGNPVTFTRNAASAGQCTVTNDAENSASVEFIGRGTCALFAHQQGDSGYLAAPTVRQRMHIYPFICGLSAADGVQRGTDRAQYVGC